MRQLVQLQGQAKEFKAAGAELVFVFREESDGVPALKKMKSKFQTQFKLTIDPGKTTKPYGRFDNYVVGADGKVLGVIPGTLRDRATATELLRILKSQ